ncbi:hypothetical protein [Marinobacter phage PS6]|nr:hypothetical protein [Marinobacter phage PS6]
MRHMGYEPREIWEDLNEQPHIVRKIISDHVNRYSPERVEAIRQTRKRQRQNKATRKRLAEQQ